MARAVTIFAGARGLYTKADPAQLGSDEQGAVYLPVALNVDIKDTRRVSRRKGHVQKASVTGPHSGFCDGGPCLFVAGENLCLLGTDFSYRVLGSLKAPSRRMRYAQAPDNKIYFGNGQDKGVFNILDGVLEPWVPDLPDAEPILSRINDLRRRFFDGEIGFDVYSRRTERYLEDAGLYYRAPLPPQHVEYYRGRLYTAYDRFIIYSQEWSFSRFSLSNSYIPMPEGCRITMIRRTSDGLYVGTTEGVYYLGGRSPDEFEQIRVSGNPPVEHTDTRVEARRFLEEARGEAVMWTSTEGICFGGPQGVYFDMTKDRMDFPAALSGTAIEKDGKYLSILTV